MPGPKLTPDDLKNLTKAMESAISKGQAVDDIITKIAGSTANWTSKILEGDQAMKKIAEKLNESSTKGGDLSDRLTSMVSAQKDLNKEFATQAFALKNNLKIEEAESELARRELLSLAKANGLSEFRQKLVLKRFDKLTESLEIQKKEAEAAERMKGYDKEKDEMMESINSKASMLKDIFTDQRALAAVGIATMIKGYHSLNETFGEFRKEGLTVGQALKETGVGVGAMFSLSGASLKENAELMAGMSESMGNMSSITTDTVAEVGKLAKTLGVSASEAGKLQGQLMNMPGATAESATNTMEFAGALAKAAHVAPGAVMKDMAANAEDIAINTKNGGKDMAVVSVAAHKLGVEMSTLTKMSAGLLDFENSINKQMEASVLLGREINLDKAREAALNGDILGATQEMLKNVGGEAEFNKMNVIQRKALADSMGVSVSDLSKMVKNQDQLANLTEEQNQALADGVPLSDVLAANAAGFAGKLKDGALGIAGVGATISEISGGFKDAKNAASGFFGGIKNGLAGMKGGGGIKGGIKGALGMDKTPELPKTDALADPGKKMSGGGMMSGFKKNMKALADGFKEMGMPGVLKGVGNTFLAGPALIVATLAIPFLLFMGKVELKKLDKNFTALATGLTAMSSTMMGSVALGVFGIAAIPAIASLPFLALFGTFPYPNLKKNFTALASGLIVMSPTKMGSVALGVFGIAAIPAIASLPFLALFGTFPYPSLKKNFTALASGLTLMSPTMMGSVALGVFGTAAIPALASVPFLALFGTFAYPNLKKNFLSLATGLLEMSPTIMGSVALGAFALAGALAIPSLIFLGGIALIGEAASAGLIALGVGLAAFGNPATAVFILIGIGLIAALGIAMIPFAYAISLLTPVLEVLGNIIIGVFSAIPPIITAIADGFVKMFGAVSQDIGSFLLLGPALIMTGMGLGLLAVAAILAAPGLILASFGLATMVLPLTALSMIASTGAINMLGNGLKLMGEAGPGLGLVAMSMMGIGAGLSLVAIAGIAALPVIGALIALATVAPALIGLGAALGGIFGGEGGEKEDKMDTLIAKIDKLISVASKGGVVNMDGKKVGDIIYQSINTTNIR